MTGINENSKGYISGIIANIIFGFSFYFTKVILDILNNDVFTVLSLRFAMGLIVVTLLYKFKVIKLKYRGKDLKSLAVLCFMQPVLYFIFETFGVRYTSTSEVGIMISMIPVITGILASIFLKEKVNLKQIVCITAAIIGVIIINLQGIKTGGSSALGRLLVLAAVTCAGVFNIYARKLSQDQFTPIEITAAMQLVGCITFLSLSLGQQAFSGDLRKYFNILLDIRIIIPVLYLGAGCSLLAMFLSNYSKATLEAVKSSILSNVATVVSIFAGIFLLKERFDLYGLVGSSLIIGSIIAMVLLNDKEEVVTEVYVGE